MSPKPKKDTLPPGITRRPSGRYQAQAFGPAGKRLSKTFGSQSAAKNWKRDAEARMARGEMFAGDSPTLRQAAEEFLAGAEAGTIRSRSRERYRQSTIKRYRRALEAHLYQPLGDVKLHRITQTKLERLVHDLQAEGLAANTVRNGFMPLQAIYRWATRMGIVDKDPTAFVELPLDRSGRDTVAAPAEITLRLATLDERDRPLWATAFYTGLRLSELTALEWGDVDLLAGTIEVRVSKSVAGVRRIAIPPALAVYLDDHRQRCDPLTQPLVFSRHSLAGRRRGPDGPLHYSGVYARARARWNAQGLEPMSFHDCRHTFASLLIAANADIKSLQQALGHSEASTSLNRYGHLFPGHEQVTAGRLQAWLDAAVESAEGVDGQ